jgi:hypothetical protein
MPSLLIRYIYHYLSLSASTCAGCLLRARSLPAQMSRRDLEQLAVGLVGQAHFGLRFAIPARRRVDGLPRHHAYLA